MKTVMIPLCLTIIFLSGLVSVGATAPLSFARSSPASQPVLDAMAQLVALAYQTDTPDWSQVAAQARQILASDGDVMYYFAKDRAITPPEGFLREANSRGASGFAAVMDWRPDGAEPGTTYIAFTSTSGTFLRALLELKDWAGVEEVTLAIIACYEADPDAWLEVPEGAYMGLLVARKKLLAQEATRASVAPVAFLGGAGYLEAPAGSAELKRLAEWLGGKLTWDKAAETGRLQLGGDTWAFKLGSRTVASSSGKRIELPATVKMYDGRLSVPLEALRIAGTVKWDSTTRIAWFTPKQG